MKLFAFLHECRDLLGELLRLDYGPATLANVLRQARSLWG